jgi:hypothetical protein
MLRTCGDAPSARCTTTTGPRPVQLTAPLRPVRGHPDAEQPSERPPPTEDVGPTGRVPWTVDQPRGEGQRLDEERPGVADYVSRGMHADPRGPLSFGPYDLPHDQDAPCGIR